MRSLPNYTPSLLFVFDHHCARSTPRTQPPPPWAQVRVVQGKEPSHFRALFKGSMVIHAGGKASGFKNSTQEDAYDADGVSLFHVRGSNATNTVGVQVGALSPTGLVGTTAK
jgi:hypothetical protein